MSQYSTDPFATPFSYPMDDAKLLDFRVSESESDYDGDISELIRSYDIPDLSPQLQEEIPESEISSLNSGYRTARSLKRNASVADLDDSPFPSAERNKVRKLTLNDLDLDLDSDDHDVPVFIAHCPAVLRAMEERGLAWGVCFEIARLVSRGQVLAKDITPHKLDLLRGPNKESAPLVPHVITSASETASQKPVQVVDKAFVQEIVSNSPWEELDREQEALAVGPCEGIGNNPRLPDWFGGKVVFQGQLVEDDGKYRVVLDSCALGGSCRFTRRFGSWSFLRIKVPQNIFYGPNRDFIDFFYRPFVIWGRVYRVFDAKDNKVFLFWTNESPGAPLTDRMSLEEFISWHNPLGTNKKQLMSKWAARMCLGLSTSVPGPRLLPENIFEEEDIVSEAKSDMTDGCGLSSKSIHYFLSHLLRLPFTVTAFQFRLAGCKGMLLLRDDGLHSDIDFQAWFRPSQRKIKYAPTLAPDPAHLTLDILRLSHMRTPAQLSTEVIINLAENQVPSDVFVRLLVDSIRATVQGLTSWEGPDAMAKLWVNVERSGRVLTARRARESISEARVRGYTNKSPDELDLEHDEEEDEEEAMRGPRSTAWWTDYTSGCPSSLEETVMVLLDSGFTPQECPILREKLQKIVISKIENRLWKVRFDVEESCVAFAVPDPYRVLGENEVQVKSSKRSFRGSDGMLTDTVLGDVLVTRNPCKIPTDVRKVRAVEHPALRNCVDVVVFSVQGHRRLIDYLGGGDYDGDKVLVIWKDSITSPFQNADEKHANEPKGLDLAFERDQETVVDFLSRTADSTVSERRKAMQKYLLGPLGDPALKGIYSNMHINAIYRDGYDNPRTVKLAAKFCRVMDAAKTGWRIKPQSFKADQAQYSHRGPEWKEVMGSKKAKGKNAVTYDTSNQRFLKRHVKREFVMDVLVRAAEREKKELFIQMEAVFAPLTNGPDPDLVRPWDELVAWSERESPSEVGSRRRELGRIAFHVQDVHRLHSKLVKETFSSLPIEDRQDKLRMISKKFCSGPALDGLPTFATAELLARWRASYAYKYDAEQELEKNRKSRSRFPFNVAMRELCDIKARAVGNHKVVLNSFYERFKLLE